MTRPPDNAQVEAVFEILQNHCPAAAGNRLVARRIVAAVEHAADQDATGSDADDPVALVVWLPRRTVAVQFADATEATTWATEHDILPLMRPSLLTKEEVITELWRGGR